MVGNRGITVQLTVDCGLCSCGLFGLDIALTTYMGFESSSLLVFGVNMVHKYGSQERSRIHCGSSNREGWYSKAFHGSKGKAVG